MPRQLDTRQLQALLEAHANELALMQKVTGWGIGTRDSGPVVQVFASGDLEGPALSRLNEVFGSQLAVIGIDEGADAY